MCKFYDVLLERVQKNKNIKFQKNKYDGAPSSLLSKTGVLQLQCTVLLMHL